MIIEVYVNNREHKTYEYDKKNPTNILAICNKSPFRVYKYHPITGISHLVNKGNIDSITDMKNGFVIQDDKQHKKIEFKIDDIDCIAVYPDVVEIYYYKYVVYRRLERNENVYL